MALPPPPDRPRGRIEAMRRQVYLLVASLACLSQTVLIGLSMMKGTEIRWDAVFGAVLCGALIPLLNKRTVPVYWVDLGVLVAASLGSAFELLVAFQRPEAPLPSLYFAGIFLFLAAYSILPVLAASLYSVVLYTAFIVLTLLKRGDTTLLVELAVVVMLIVHLSVFGQRVTAERTEAQVFELLSRTDALTGLENRRAMYERLDRAFNHAAPEELSAVLLLDIDHFKLVNDRYGHPVGDEVLRALATVLQQLSSPLNGVSRWGGEEFLVLLVGVTQERALETAQRLLADIRATSLPLSLQVTASCGVAFSYERDSVAEWLLSADERLYMAKTGGRNRVHPVRPPPLPAK
ncbi:GGDEF domain-containing protein (plasmid) [Deinococcus sp. KNUC1210]|uniref:GGDEF domain-containing protein n=1 Tax=Deinococcus sp. KNUC1210 TaxID=2917691 RepID=UPI001EEFAFAD|nr:GGDEF domain-containing protein [Deinococcus sp. KNUC1210]ULH17956.1 GGDEF domain-containing protein [Deinococcus sp. KNUC1210]